MITRQKLAQENVPPSPEILARYQARQAIMDQINSRWDASATHRLETYRNPATGEKIALPTGFSAAWINPRLDILLTSSPSDPNTPTSPWTRLEKAQ